MRFMFSNLFSLPSWDSNSVRPQNNRPFNSYPCILDSLEEDTTEISTEYDEPRQSLRFPISSYDSEQISGTLWHPRLFQNPSMFTSSSSSIYPAHVTDGFRSPHDLSSNSGTANPGKASLISQDPVANLLGSQTRIAFPKEDHGLANAQAISGIPNSFAPAKDDIHSTNSSSHLHTQQIAVIMPEPIPPQYSIFKFFPSSATPKSKDFNFSKISTRPVLEASNSSVPNARKISATPSECFCACKHNTLLELWEHFSEKGNSQIEETERSVVSSQERTVQKLDFSDIHSISAEPINENTTDEARFDNGQAPSYPVLTPDPFNDSQSNPHLSDEGLDFSPASLRDIQNSFYNSITADSALGTSIDTPNPRRTPQSFAIGLGIDVLEYPDPFESFEDSDSGVETGSEPSSPVDFAGDLSHRPTGEVYEPRDEEPVLRKCPPVSDIPTTEEDKQAATELLSSPEFSAIQNSAENVESALPGVVEIIIEGFSPKEGVVQKNIEQDGVIVSKELNQMPNDAELPSPAHDEELNNVLTDSPSVGQDSTELTQSQAGTTTGSPKITNNDDLPPRNHHAAFANRPAFVKEDPSFYATTFFEEDLNRFVERQRLHRFYPKNDSRISKIAEKAAQLVAEGEDPQYICALTKIALYDIVMLCDDSGSMRQSNRISALKEALNQILQIVTTLGDGGISVRWLNTSTDKKIMDGLKSPEELMKVLTKVEFRGGTMLGGQLQKKVLNPFLLKKMRTKLERPVLVDIITDGEPDDPKEAITNIRQIKFDLRLKKYEESAIAFHISQVGDSLLASYFLDQLAEDEHVGKYIYCTAGRVDEGANGSVQWWAQELLTAIDPFPVDDAA